MARCYAGDEQAFDEIERRYRSRLVGFFQNAGVPDEDANDLAQETLIRVTRTKGTPTKYDPSKGASFKTWLFRIATNLLIDHWRKKGRRPEDLFSELESEEQEGEADLEELIPSEEPTPKEALIEEEVRKAIRDYVKGCLAELTEEERLVVTLWKGTSEKPFLGDLATLKKVSQVLQAAGFKHASVPTVSRRADSAWEKLKECLRRKAAADEDFRAWLRKWRSAEA